MKYLQKLESQIWQSKEKDEEIYQCLQCEIKRAVEIEMAASEYYWNNRPQNIEHTYEYEEAYKHKILDLLSKIEQWLNTKS